MSRERTGLAGFDVSTGVQLQPAHAATASGFTSLLAS
jgi:hypothetical protein